MRPALRQRKGRRDWIVLCFASLALALTVPVLPLIIPGGLRVGRFSASAEVYRELEKGPWVHSLQRQLEGAPLRGAAAGPLLPWSEGRECQITVGNWTYRILISYG